MRLNRRHVERLQQLRLQQFTDPGDLVARQHEYESAKKRCAEKLLGSVLTDFQPSTNPSC